MLTRPDRDEHTEKYPARYHPLTSGEWGAVNHGTLSSEQSFKNFIIVITGLTCAATSVTRTQKGREPGHLKLCRPTCLLIRTHAIGISCDKALGMTIACAIIVIHASVEEY